MEVTVGGEPDPATAVLVPVLPCVVPVAQNAAWVETSIEDWYADETGAGDVDVSCPDVSVAAGDTYTSTLTSDVGNALVDVTGAVRRRRHRPAAPLTPVAGDAGP